MEKQEKIIIKNSRGLNLVGEIAIESDTDIVVLCHGFTGDRHEFGKFDKVAQAINREKISTFAFDFSGSGESDDDALLVAKQIDDLDCVVAHLQTLGFKRFGFFGHSLGGLVCLKWFNKHKKEIAGMVFWAPVTNKIKYTWDKRFSQEELRQAREFGYIVKYDKKRVRGAIKIDAQIMKEREEVDQRELVENVTCPVLIIHGTEDLSVPLSDSREAVEFNSNLRLIEVDGADHGFNGFVDEIAKESANFFAEKIFCRKK